MEDSNNKELPKKIRAEDKTPGDRAALKILAVFQWFKDCFSSFRMSRPEGKIVKHHGKPLAEKVSLRFPRILLVEDNMQTAQDFVDVLRHYYQFGNVEIYVAYSFASAVSFFSTANINLVIMDSDLTDAQGNGLALTKKFSKEKPESIILANSSSKTSNAMLVSNGANATIGKDFRRLQKWLFENDKAGANI